MDPKMTAKGTVWTHMLFCFFLRHISDMLKLTIVTITFSRHAETDNFDHKCIPDMLKLTILTMTYYSHAEDEKFMP
jgi:hypothetical protein